MWKIIVFAFIVLIAIILLVTLSRGDSKNNIDNKNTRNIKTNTRGISNKVISKPPPVVTSKVVNPVKNSIPPTIVEEKPISLNSNFTNHPVINSIMNDRGLNNVIDLSKKE